MGGFLPLIEAFAAFALTMVALTTAVGAILGIGQRGLRMRAHGLRQLVIYFFRNEIKPRLALLQKAGQTLPWSSPEEALPRFLVDMTFLPTVRPITVGGPDPRVTAAEVGLTGNPLTRWQSWGYGVDSLNDGEFSTRLKASELYAALTAHQSSDQQTATIGELATRYQAYARAASESFARTARIGTVLLGLLLAFGLNIDAFALLGRYMSDPKLTSEILAKQASILKDGGAGGGAASTKRPADAIDLRVATLQAKLDALNTAIAGIGSAAAGSDIETVRKAALDTQAALKPVQDDLAAASDATGVFGNSATAIKGELADLSRAFPIGWALYPGCNGATLDSRCLSVIYSKDLPNEFWHKLGWIAENDTGDFLRWFGGTLILGLLLGLGTPFWVEVTNNFLRARELIADPRPEAPPVSSLPATSVAAGLPTATASQPAQTPATRRLV